MKGDFSRNTFDPKNQFTRVLMQQGRVQIDADWNEQVSIVLHQLRVMAADIIGSHGFPSTIPSGFEIVPSDSTFTIGAGRYYVDGLLCENPAGVTYSGQPDCSDVDELPDAPFFVYLDVWERHLTHYETDAPIREVALGGADTATRAKLVWQVRILEQYITYSEGEKKELIAVEIDVPPVPNDLDNKPEEQKKLHKFCSEWLKHIRNKEERRGEMKAFALDNLGKKDACTIPPDAAYRGVENQLYRVEIHDGYDEDGKTRGTFKFSRENGSVIFPLAKAVNGPLITLKHLGKDGRLSLKKGDWVEVVDDDTALSSTPPPPLYQVVDVKAMKNIVELSDEPEAGKELSKHPVLRRWDQKDTEHLELNNCGVAMIDPDQTYTLEKGIAIQFKVNDLMQLRPGDYWLIPARVATGKIEWSQENEGFHPPNGVEHHYAPLAIISDGNKHDCRKQFDPLCYTPDPNAVPVEDQLATVEERVAVLETASHEHEEVVTKTDIQTAIDEQVKDRDHEPAIDDGGEVIDE